MIVFILYLAYVPPLSYLHGKKVRENKLMPVQIMNNVNMNSRTL